MAGQTFFSPVQDLEQPVAPVAGVAWASVFTPEAALSLQQAPSLEHLPSEFLEQAERAEYPEQGQVKDLTYLGQRGGYFG